MKKSTVPSKRDPVARQRNPDPPTKAVPTAAQSKPFTANFPQSFRGSRGAVKSSGRIPGHTVANKSQRGKERKAPPTARELAATTAFMPRKRAAMRAIIRKPAGQGRVIQWAASVEAAIRVQALLLAGRPGSRT